MEGKHTRTMRVRGWKSVANATQGVANSPLANGRPSRRVPRMPSFATV